MDYIDFADWLEKQIAQKGWSQADLARYSGVNRQVISTYVNRKRTKPDAEVLRSIAHALNMPEETVFRAAGLLKPAIDDVSDKVHQLTDLAKNVDEPTVDLAIAMLEAALKQKQTGANASLKPAK